MLTVRSVPPKIIVITKKRIPKEKWTICASIKNIDAINAHTIVGINKAHLGFLNPRVSAAVKPITIGVAIAINKIAFDKGKPDVSSHKI
jgi:hypothetical protein